MWKDKKTSSPDYARQCKRVDEHTDALRTSISVLESELKRFEKIQQSLRRKISEHDRKVLQNSHRQSIKSLKEKEGT